MRQDVSARVERAQEAEHVAHVPSGAVFVDEVRLLVLVGLNAGQRAHVALGALDARGKLHLGMVRIVLGLGIGVQAPIDAVVHAPHVDDGVVRLHQVVLVAVYLELEVRRALSAREEVEHKQAYAFDHFAHSVVLVDCRHFQLDKRLLLLLLLLL